MASATSIQTLKITPARLNLFKVANVISYCLCFGFNILAITLPLNGKSTKELSDQYPSLFTPAGLTFSIWSLIYLLLLLFTGWQCWPIRSTQRRVNRDQAIGALGWQVVIVSMLNIGWLFCWHYEYVAISVLVMFTLLYQLIRINRLIFHTLPPARDFRNFLQIPYGLYLGWISVASIANTSAWLISVQWDGFGLSESLWTGVMIVIAVVLATWMILIRRNIPFALAVSWALWGISLKHQELFNTSMSTIIFIAYAGIALLLLAAAAKLRPWWRQASNGNNGL